MSASLLADDDDGEVQYNSAAVHLMRKIAKNDAYVRQWIETQLPDALAGDTSSDNRCWLAIALHALVAPNIRVAVYCVYFDRDGEIGEVIEMSGEMTQRVLSLEHLYPGTITWRKVIESWDSLFPFDDLRLPLLVVDSNRLTTPFKPDTTTSSN